MTYYEDYMILYPGDSNIALAAAGVDKMKTILAKSKIYIGDFYFYKRLNFTAAKVFYNEAITAYPDSPTGEDRQEAPGRLGREDLEGPRRAEATAEEAVLAVLIEPGWPAMTRVWSLLLLSAFLAQGCANYRLGTGADPSFATLFIEPAKNKTKLAQSQALVSTMIREAFIRDGRVTVVDNPDEADATLEVTLVNYHRDNAANREDDVGLARKFTLYLRASCRLRDNRTGRMLFDGRIVEVQREAFTDNGLGSVPFGTSNDQLQSEYNTLPLLAELPVREADPRRPRRVVSPDPASPRMNTPILAPSLLAGDHGALAEGRRDRGEAWPRVAAPGHHGRPFRAEPLVRPADAGRAQAPRLEAVLRHPPDAFRAAPLRRRLRKGRRGPDHDPHRARLRPRRGVQGHQGARMQGGHLR